jgi:carbamoyltransferase
LSSHRGIWLGFGCSATIDGRPQVDGAVAFLVEDAIHSLPEERLSRKKHDGNVWRALQHGMAVFGINPNEVESVIVSTCGEPVPTGTSCIPIRTDSKLHLADIGIAPNRTRWQASHHESHAFEALYSASTLGNLDLPAFVFVADRIGQPGEHQSGYLFDGEELNLVWRQSERVGLSGFGLVYDRITHHLGMKENFDAGKTMALAGLGEPIAEVDNYFFSTEDGNLRIHWPKDYELSMRRFSDLIVKSNSQSLPHCAVAATLQYELEKSLVVLASRWIEEFQPATFLFSGGVATNCKLVGRLANSFPNIVVRGSLAPTDFGQGIGNLAGAFFRQYGKFPLGNSFNKIRNAFFPQFAGKKRLSTKDLCRALVSGKFLLICSGDHEPGPRSLGFHSLIADARDINVKSRVNKILKREGFRPFGAIMTSDAAHKWFGARVTSPFMDLAINAPSLLRLQYPAVVHEDGSIRLQTLSSLTQGSLIEDILTILHLEFGVDLLLNTSLNSADQPIAFCPSDVVELRQLLGDSGLLIADHENEQLLKWQCDS